MLTKEQQNWLNKLSDTHRITIIPYNPKVKEIFAKQQTELSKILGPDIPVLHKGASALGISSKGDIDIYMPVAFDQFDPTFKLLKPELGEPGSYYPQERVRWKRQSEGIEIEIFLVNQDAQFWKNDLIFMNYLETHPHALAEYQKLKEDADGTTSREYYTRKTVFINRILELIKSTSV